MPEIHQLINYKRQQKLFLEQVPSDWTVDSRQVLIHLPVNCL